MKIDFVDVATQFSLKHNYYVGGGHKQGSKVKAVVPSSPSFPVLKSPRR